MPFCAGKTTCHMCAALSLLLCIVFSPALAGEPPQNKPSAGQPALSELKLSEPTAAEQRLWEAVQNVNDPELHIGIVDLGLVRHIVIHDTPAGNAAEQTLEKASSAKAAPDITLTLVLTSPLCPFTRELLRDIRDAIQTAMPGKRLKVVLDTKTRWTPDLMTPEGKRRFAGGS